MGKTLTHIYFCLLFLYSLIYIYCLGADTFGNSVLAFILGYVGFGVVLMAFYVILFVHPNFLLKNPLNKKILLWMCFASASAWVMSDNIFFDFRQVVMWGCTYIIGFNLGVKSPSNMGRYYKWALVSLPIFVLLFFSISRFRTASLGTNDVIASVNYVYYILLLLPVFLSYTNKKIQIILLLVVLICTFFSMKRTAIIALIISLLIYLYYNSLKNNTNMARKLLLGCLICAGIYFAYSKLENSYLFSRFASIQEDKGSGRIEIYEIVLDKYWESSGLEKFLGHGYDNVLRTDITKENLSAHNDGLEVLYDYGALGLILYIGIILALFRLAKRVRHNCQLNYLYPSMLISLVLFIIVSTFSHLIIYPTYFLFLTCFWGILNGMLYSNSHQISQRVSKHQTTTIL